MRFKYIIMKKLHYFLASTLLLMTACSESTDELTTEKAKEIISAYYPKYCSNERGVKTIYIYGDETNRKQKQFLSRIQEVFSTAEATGLATINVSGNNPTTYKINLNEVAKKKYGDKIPHTATNFVEIIGVSQNGKEAIVKYKLESVKTIFFNLQKTSEKLKCYETAWEHNVTLVRYDTGWQVK